MNVAIARAALREYGRRVSANSFGYRMDPNRSDVASWALFIATHSKHRRDLPRAGRLHTSRQTLASGLPQLAAVLVRPDILTFRQKNEA